MQALPAFTASNCATDILANKENFDRISSAEEELICDVLLEELCDVGLNTDLEPDERGLRIERAIDAIQSSRKIPMR